MQASKTLAVEERVLTLAPTGRDSILARDVLRQGGLEAVLCRDMEELCAKLGAGAGTALIANEALSESDIALLQDSLAKAPAWSDLPLIVLTMGQSQTEWLAQDDDTLSRLGNVTFLERPVRPQTLVTAVKSALRARRRQYQLRDLLAEQQRTVERLDVISEVASHLLLSEQPREVVSSVFGKIAAHLGLEVFLCYLLDETTHGLRLSAHAGLGEDAMRPGGGVASHETFSEAVVHGGRRIIAENVPASKSPDLAPLQELGLGAYACFPLLSSGRMMGTLSFGIRRRNWFEREELAILETVCNQVAVAISRKQTEEALQHLNEELERRVEERTAQLKDSNEQMEAFTYSISHDLRAPLRAIRGFAQALAEDYGPALDSTGRDYLDRMSRGAERLDVLIQDLLQYSRLSRSTLSFAPVELGQTVQSVLQQLEPELLATHAKVEVCKPLPVVLGHEPTLEQVLVNLVSNAIKFIAPGASPCIRIRATEDGPMARLWIEDNGIGIAPAHHQRIFGVFERLHTGDAFPGTGIGLAIVAKGISRMGGRTGVESNVGQGSRFWIELPQTEVDLSRTHRNGQG